MTTVAEINRLVSEIQAKIAVTECVVAYLQTNYMTSSDEKDTEVAPRPPEMRINKADYSTVTEDQISSTIMDYVDYCDSLRAELNRLESLSVGSEPKALPKTVKKKGGSNDRSDHKDQSASKQSASAKAG